MVEQAGKEAKTFSDVLRQVFKGIVEPIAAFLIHIGIKPNTVTIAGLLGHAAAAYLVASGQIALGGVAVLLMAPADFLDGTMARLLGESSRFGAFIDSVTDRYSEFVILGGLLAYYLQQQNWLGCGLVYLAATGSMLVSYVRSRAEGLDYEAKVGFLTRVERYIVLVPALILNYPMIGLWIISIFSHFTALQRILHVRRQAHIEMGRRQ